MFSILFSYVYLFVLCAFSKGTGAVDEIGKGAGKYYNVNVPLSGGVDDATYIRLFLK